MIVNFQTNRKKYRKKSLSTFEKLRIKILNDLNLDCENFKRTYAGRNMQSSGAFVWSCTIKNNTCEYGSSISATELLKKEKLILIPCYGRYREIFYAT